MKILNTLKFSLLTIFILSITYGCGGGKTVIKEVKTNQENVVEVIIPCSGSKYESDNKHFRGTAIGVSEDMNMAKKIALRTANTNLATDMSVQITQVAEDYSGQTVSGTNSNYRAKFQDNTQSVVDENVNSSRTICERITQDKSTGKYTVYISREASSKEVFTKLNESLSNDEELRVDYDYEKFKETFEKVMEKRKNE